MTATELSALAGVALSLLFTYTPGLRTKFEPLSAERKSLIMLVLIVIVAVSVYSASCAGLSLPFVTGEVACDLVGARGLISNVLYALVTNQATFLISPKAETKST